mmetsp:Transcript_14436/g.60227  ORF Transcript_14436/g.60227 Transcript_14436/m.60227 type:complete len:208 (+) Transcript_14436:237-860(+)
MSASPVTSSRMVSSLGVAPVSRDLGGANLTWYERPLDLWIHRPQMRSSRISSGTSSASTLVTPSPVLVSISSSIFACSSVRGKPSRMKPPWQSDSVMRSRMIPTTISSLTRPPDSITAFAFRPTSVPAETAARSMSPVESCGTPSASTILGACDPLPAPGGPKRIMIDRSPPAARARSRRPTNRRTGRSVATLTTAPIWPLRPAVAL